MTIPINTYHKAKPYIYTHTDMCLFNDISRENKLQGENAAFKLAGQTKQDEAKSSLSCPLCLHLNQCTISTEQVQNCLQCLSVSLVLWRRTWVQTKN